MTAATDQLKQALGRGSSSDVLLLKVPCRNLVVGQATSSASSILSVFSDRLEYKFLHEKQKNSVEMLMRFRDIDRADLDLQLFRLTFHVCRPLNIFGMEYDHTKDQLSLQFCSRDDAVAFSLHLSLLRSDAM